MSTTGAICLAGLLLAPGLAAAAGAKILNLDIGDPARKGREVPLRLDAITDTTSGEAITPAEMVRRLADTGILFIGEEHTNNEFHLVQMRTIRALHEAGRPVLIGLEMFPYTAQSVLDNWNSGRYTEQGFVELGGWYEHWGYHWNYYRDIFLYAREHGIPMYAINSPRETVKAVREKGFGDLTPEQAAHLPPQLAPETEEFRRMYRAFFEEDDALHRSEAAMAGLYRAQSLWDATMGWNALQALKQHGPPGAIMVVLIGAGHVTYGLGAERQIAPHYEGRIASLIPVPVYDDTRKPVEKLRASFASYVWGVPREDAPTYPTLGVSLMGAIGREPTQVIQVSKDSVGERAGIKLGDVLLEFGGKPIDNEVALRRALSGYRWGDAALARLRRDGQEREIEVTFRRPSTP